jgi:hypothetical protein
MMSPALARALRHLTVALILIGVSAPVASAQYFGRNKVHYRTFDFEVLKTEHFDIYFYPEAREGVDLAARMAERWLARLERVLQHELRGRQPLVLYASQPHFQQTNTIGGEIGEGTGGVTESLRRRIVLPLAGSLIATDHVIGHELVHAFQFDITARQNGAPGESGAHHLPLWFVEGMAEYLSIGPVDANTAMWMRDAVRADAVPPIDKLGDAQYFPYRWGQAFWAYVAGRWGALGAVAGGHAQRVRTRPLGDDSAERSRPSRALRRPGPRRRPEHRAGHQSRRPVDCVPVRAQPVFDRPLHRRRHDRGGRTAAHEHCERPAPRQPAVHPLRGGLGRGQHEARRRDDHER